MIRLPLTLGVKDEQQFACMRKGGKAFLKERTACARTQTGKGQDTDQGKKMWFGVRL